MPLMDAADPAAPHSMALSMATAADQSAASFTPIPGGSPRSISGPSAPLTPILYDSRALGRLLEALLDRAGLTPYEAAKKLGVGTNTVQQYTAGRRSNPGLMWFIKIATLCGARILIEFPK